MSAPQNRVTERNGARDRTLSTQAGDVSLRIPKLRQGAFFPVILEPRRRIDQALHAVVMEAYVHGVSTRSVDDLVQALGIDTGISKSEVSRICAGLDEGVTAFRTRILGHAGFPYVCLDATYLARARQPPRGGDRRARAGGVESGSWSPPGSPPPAAGRCSVSRLGTARRRRSGGYS